MRKSGRDARDKRRSRTPIVNSSKPVTTSVPASPPENNDQAGSLLEQATGMLSWQEVKDLINMSRGIGTPGETLRHFARSIVGNTEISTVEDKELLETFGTTDKYFARGLIAQIVTMGSIRGDSGMGGDGYDFAVSVLRGVKPKNQIAAMLATQMAATHMAVIRYINRLARADLLPIHDSEERTLNKLLRVFVMQFEAFNRHQNGGERNVTVQNVSVSEFGQAIVGNVTQGAVEQSAGTPALTQSKQQAMPPLSGLENDEYLKAAYATRTKSTS